MDAPMGIFFSVVGVAEANGMSFAVLVSADRIRYFPIMISDAYHDTISHLLNNPSAPPVGLFHTVTGIMKAVGVKSGRISLDLVDDKDGPYFACLLDFLQVNNIGILMGRVPIMLQDACVLSIITDIPIVAYENISARFTRDLPGNFFDRDNSAIIDVVAKQMTLEGVGEQDIVKEPADLFGPDV